MWRVLPQLCPLYHIHELSKEVLYEHSAAEQELLESLAGKWVSLEVGELWRKLGPSSCDALLCILHFQWQMTKIVVCFMIKAYASNLVSTRNVVLPRYPCCRTYSGAKLRINKAPFVEDSHFSRRPMMDVESAATTLPSLPYPSSFQRGIVWPCT